MAIVHLTKDNFDKEVLQSETPVLVDFWADWCGPCQMLMPTIEQIVTEDPSIKIGKLNVDEEPELASQYRVMSIPTLIVFDKGQVANTAVGVQPKAKILAMLKDQ